MWAALLHGWALGWIRRRKGAEHCYSSRSASWLLVKCDQLASCSCPSAFSACSHVSLTMVEWLHWTVSWNKCFFLKLSFARVIYHSNEKNNQMQSLAIVQETGEERSREYLAERGWGYLSKSWHPEKVTKFTLLLDSDQYYRKKREISRKLWMNAAHIWWVFMSVAGQIRRHFSPEAFLSPVLSWDPSLSAPLLCLDTGSFYESMLASHSWSPCLSFLP